MTRQATGSGRVVGSSRVVSLVPSLTETVAELGCAGRLIGVTRYCEVGVPVGAERIGGTKNPDVKRIAALGCDLVLANVEENRTADLDALRAAGIPVHRTFPRRVADVPPMLRGVAAALAGGAGGGEPAILEAGEDLAGQVEQALAEAGAGIPGFAGARPLRALTLVWRKPWMGLGVDTYAADLLVHAGLATVLDRGGDRYPRLMPGDPELEDLDVVLLPTEPYAFTDDDLPAVHDLVGPVRHAFVDGRSLTWHGRRTADALASFATLAATLHSHAGA